MQGQQQGSGRLVFTGDVLMRQAIIGSAWFWAGIGMTVYGFVQYL